MPAYMKFIGKNKIVDAVFRKMVFNTLNKRLKTNSVGKKYYVIQRKSTAGFFSCWFYALGHIALADRYGLIPVVDWQTYKTLYNEDEEFLNTFNAFEYYYSQSVSAKEALKFGDSVICEEKYPYGTVPYYSVTNLKNEGVPTKKQIALLNSLIEKYMPLHSDLIKEFETQSEKLKLDECIGVHVRGTDMTHTMGHNVPASLQNIIEILKNQIAKENIKRIFLCTDEDSVKDKMVELFGHKVCFTDSYRAVGDNSGLHLEKNPHIKREHHKYMLGKEVLRDAYLLSKCDHLICGKSNVGYAAVVMNNNKFKTVTYTN